jgi:uncharacterized protein
MANASCGLGHAFLDQEWPRVPNPDHRLDSRIYARKFPGRLQATKSCLNSLFFALREELRETRVRVTCPEAPLKPNSRPSRYARYQSGIRRKDDTAMVAKTGFEALLKGDGDVVSGWRNKVHLVPM